MEQQAFVRFAEPFLNNIWAFDSLQRLYSRRRTATALVTCKSEIEAQVARY